MLHLNKTIIPDPNAPVALDAYGDEAGPGLVVYAVNETPGGRAGLLTLVCAYRGAAVSMPSGMLPAFVVSIGFRPLGRLERHERGVKPRPEDFDLAAAVNDVGPRLRALREQTGLRIGEFARALGCPLPDLSRIELGEWVDQHPDRVGLSEVREDDVVAMAREAVVAFQAGQDFYITKKAIARGEYEMTLTLRLAAPSTEQ